MRIVEPLYKCRYCYDIQLDYGLYLLYYNSLLFCHYSAPSYIGTIAEQLSKVFSLVSRPDIEYDLIARFVE
jgi:hypothetical protein